MLSPNYNTEGELEIVRCLWLRSGSGGALSTAGRTAIDFRSFRKLRKSVVVRAPPPTLFGTRPQPQYDYRALTAGLATNPHRQRIMTQNAGAGTGTPP